ncbi:hypothetical protein [Anabaena sp. CCY 9402-a]|uniref:hypothetical protein n=1 Tax=Anabaena sp. CCY 9402-a TaxID=3103867 RepID=UPI0039C6D9C7
MPTFRKIVAHLQGVGGVVARSPIKVQHLSRNNADGEIFLASADTFYTDLNGDCEFTLWCNEEGEVASQYRITLPDESFFDTVVPVGTSDLELSVLEDGGVDSSDPQYTSLISFILSEIGDVGSGGTATPIASPTVSGKVKIDAVAGDPVVYLKSTVDTLLGSKANTSALSAHIADDLNPHEVTAIQVGAIPTSEKGVVNGVATLNGSGTIPDNQIASNITRDTELTSALGSKADSSALSAHIADALNPHVVNATQVGKDTSQWNADRIQGVTVDDSAKANGRVLKFNSGTNTLIYADDLLGEAGGGEANTASNVGVGGVGIFKQKAGVNFELRNINAGSNRITVTLDATNNEVDIDVNQANLTLTSIGGTLSIAKGGTGATTAGAALTALGAIASTEKGANNGLATLDSGGTIPDSQIPASITRDSELTSGLSGKADASALTTHIADDDNPHVVTAAQVGNATAQWNASAIQGISVSTTTPTVDQVLKYNGTIWIPADDEEGSGGGSTPAIINATYTSGLWYYSFPATATTTAGFNAGWITYTPVVVRDDLTISEVGINVTTFAASSTVRIGLYTDANGQPNELVVDFGTVEATSNGGKNIVLGSSLLIPRGFYWGAIQSDTNVNLTTISSSPITQYQLGSSSIGTTNFQGYRTNVETVAALPDPAIITLTNSGAAALLWFKSV